MPAYVIGLEQLGYTLLNEIRIFNAAVGQQGNDAMVMNIYRELMAQIVAAYSENDEEISMTVSNIPVWPTILYVEDQHAFFDIKREFASRVRLFALGLYGFFRQNIAPNPGVRLTYLMESASATIVIVNVYLDSNFA